MNRAPSPTAAQTAASVRTLVADGSLSDLPPPFRSLTECAKLHALRVAPGGEWALASTVTTGAAHLDDDAFRAAAETQVRETVALLRDGSSRSIARMWSFIPRIDDSSVDGDRYRTFNAGRAAAFKSLVPALAVLPAASGVGHGGESLVIHALAVSGAIAAVENPRQIPAWRYSRQFGASPPMFARGCIARDAHETSFFASGTASVVGEQSMHRNDFRGQLHETLRNLESLCVEAGLPPSHALRSLRVHLRPADASHASLVNTALRGVVPDADIEFVLAPLCRQELAIEIEGCAWSHRP